MLLFVLPRFEDLFEQIDGPLPVTTSLLLETSLLMRTYWWIIPPAILACVIAALLAMRREAVRDAVSGTLLKLPRLGPLLTNIATANLARMLGTLLECKVPLLDALELTQQSLKNRQYARLVHEAHDAVTRGEAISAAFMRSDLISPCVQEAIQHGEVSGQLGAPLVQMADFLDEENDVIVKTITRLLEPSILAVLGVVVGVIAMSMFLPLFDLISSANGGH